VAEDERDKDEEAAREEEEESRAREKRAMWLKLGLDALMRADPRDEVTCSSVHTGNGLTD